MSGAGNYPDCEICSHKECGKWIKLSEEKPKQFGVYLATNGEEIIIAGYWHFGWGSIERGAPFKPTHWMLLPAPPKE